MTEAKSNIPPELLDVTREKLQAEAAKATAEARKANAEAASAELMSESMRHSVRMNELQLREMEYSAKVDEARDERHHVYWFTGEVTGASVATCISRLTTWDRIDPGCDMTVVFNSPGGSVIPGMALFDFLTTMRANGHKLTTVCRGFAASMAGILLQAGEHRVIGRESYLMIHEISAGTMGKIGEIKDDVKFYETLCDRVVDIFVSRSGGKCTRARFVKNWTRTDWWLTSDETVKLGFADEIG